MTTTLIFCMSHLRTDYEGRLLRVWQQMLEELNGPQDLLIVDSASPLPISDYLDLSRPWYLQVAHDDQQLKTKGDRSIIRFNDKRGHPFTMASRTVAAQTVR